jgi:hypothetical protein
MTGVLTASGSRKCTWGLSDGGVGQIHEDASVQEV